MSRAVLICLTGLLTAATPLWPTSTASATAADPTTPKINTITGQVVDQQGNPVPNTKIGIANTETGALFLNSSNEIWSYGDNDRVLWFFTKRNGCAVKEATSDEHGKFKANNIKSGRLSVLALHPEKGYAVMPDIKYPKEDEILTVTLSPKASFKGNITGVQGSQEIRMAHMTPVEDLPGIYLNQFLCLTSNAQGEIAAIPCPPAKWKLVVDEYIRDKGFSATLLEVPIELRSGQTTNFNLDLSAGSKLTGEVKGPKGEPLKYVSVVLRQNAAPKTAYGAVTDSKGKYTIQGPPPGAYSLEAKRWARRTAPG